MFVRLSLALILVLFLCSCDGGGQAPQGGVYRACIMNASRAYGVDEVASNVDSRFFKYAISYEYDSDRRCYVREWVFPGGLHHSLILRPESADVFFDVEYVDEGGAPSNISVRVSPYRGWKDFDGNVARLRRGGRGFFQSVGARESPCTPWLESNRDEDLCYSETLLESDLYILTSYIRGRNGRPALLFNEAYAAVDSIYYVHYTVPRRKISQSREINDHVVSVVRSYLSGHSGELTP